MSISAAAPRFMRARHVRATVCLTASAQSSQHHGNVVSEIPIGGSKHDQHPEFGVPGSPGIERGVYAKAVWNY